MRLVEGAIQQARCRAAFKLVKQTDVQLDDLQGHLMRFQPHTVHFSGHGDGAGSIVVMEDRKPISPPIDALYNLLANLGEGVRLVVLNSCFSQPLAERLAEVVDCVIGTGQAIEDEAAIAFASALYGGLAYGKSLHTAFGLGVNALDLRRYPGSAAPRLLTRQGIDARRVCFC